jgi:phosphoglycerate kinase
LDVSSLSEKDIRLQRLVPTLKFLIENNSKIILTGHRGRPEGKVNNEYSLKPVIDVLENMLELKINFVFDIAGVEANEESNKLQGGEIMCLENLRFDSREEENDDAFSKSLSELRDIYVNEAFSVCHRIHASIVGIPKYLQSYAGLNLEKEIENLSKIKKEPERPLVVLVSGVKEDKLKMVEPLSKLADKVLVGGRLPDLMGDKGLESVRLATDTQKIIVGNLIMDKEDITLNTIDRFTKEVLKAKTIVLAGVLGKFEDEGHSQGTIKVFQAVANSKAFKVVGGGDSLSAINKYNLQDKFDWISVGGGAMLEFLVNSNLVGIEALQN